MKSPQLRQDCELALPGDLLTAERDWGVTHLCGYTAEIEEGQVLTPAAHQTTLFSPETSRRCTECSVVVESNEFESKSESSWSESKSESSWSESESKSSWLISDLGIYVAREPKNDNFEKCNHKNLSTLKTDVTKLGL